jgi:hypothetical protein
MVTWQPFIAQIIPDFMANIAAQVRDILATQGTPLTLREYLTRAVDGMPLVGPPTEELQTQWFNLLTQNRDASSTYAQYIASFATPEKPFATAFVAALERTGMVYEEFQNGGQDEAVETLLQTNSATLWGATHQALQIRGQRFLDQEERLTAFNSAIGTEWAPAFTELLERLTEADAYASLYTAARLPLNQLALTLSPIADTQYLALSVQQFHDLAVEVRAANYLLEVEQEVFIRKAPWPSTAVLALLKMFAADPSEAIGILASNTPEALLDLLGNDLPANSPVVYALAQAFQARITQFMASTSTGTSALAPPPPTERYVRGRLTGLDDKPLANAGLRLAQVLNTGALRELGQAYTSPDGGFSLQLLWEYELDGQDVVTQVPTTVQVDVYAPGKPFTEDPDVSQPYTLAVDQQELLVTTNLPTELPPLVSQEMAAVIGDTSPAVEQYLTDLAAEELTTLADIRHAGGLLSRNDAALADEAVLAAAHRLDAFAQFEVVTEDSSLTEELVDQGYTSPRQLVSQTTREELVQTLAAEDDPRWPDQAQHDARRRLVAALYEQTAAVDALTQTLGLFAATEAASQGESVQLLDLSSTDEREPLPVETYSTTDPIGGTLVAAYQPAVPALVTTQQPGQQCDCPACRSAVGPTAYLAALLKYAETNLRGTRSVLTFLQDTFRQPFCEMAVSCQHAEVPVCQYRLAIEVLQAQWRNRVSPAPGRALTFADAAPYVEAVLDALLQNMGTSTAELRATTSPEDRSSLAARLRVSPDDIEALQQRFAKSTLSGRLLDALEDDLEQVFGLASTARDPLSTGSQLAGSTQAAAASAVHLTRWAFQDIRWEHNTGTDGQLYVEVLVDTRPRPQHQVVVYKDTKSEDNVVARGQLVEGTPVPITGGTRRQFTALLYPQHGSKLRGSVVIAVNPPVPGAPFEDTTFQLALLPAVTAWRLQKLEMEWQDQAREAVQPLQSLTSDGWNGRRFLIDPDVLGPDDFRPLTNSATDLGNRAFQLWKHRYGYLEGQEFTDVLPAPQQGVPQPPVPADFLTPILNGVTNAARPITYLAADGVTLYSHRMWTLSQAPYAALTGAALLERLQTDLQSSSVEQVAKAVGALREIGLSREAFDRLYTLWKRAQAAMPLPALSPDEETEARNILRQTLKTTFAQDWGTEEVAGSASTAIVFNTKWFQSAIHEPREGRWTASYTGEFNISPASMPRIDPQEITPLDLPDPGVFGDTAAVLWGNRSTELFHKQQLIAAQGSSAATPELRAAAQLEYAYRVDPAQANTPTVPAPFASLEAAWDAYQDQTHAQHGVANTYFNQTLALRPAEAERLLALRAQAFAGASASEALWSEMAGLLTLGWKRTVAYSKVYGDETGQTAQDSWLAIENDSVASTDLLRTLTLTRKHRLVKWRASATERARWTMALGRAGQRPLIDPDQLVAGDFWQAGEKSRNVWNPAVIAANQPYLNPAFAVYNRRQAIVNQWYNEFEAAWSSTSATTNQTLVAAELNISWLDLVELQRQQALRVDVAAALARLNLPATGLALLIEQASTLTPATDRHTEVLHLLVQLRKIRRYADWQREEIALGLYASPRYFQEPQSEAALLPTMPGRSNARERRQWRQTLAAHYDQALATAAAQQQSVKSVEDQYLPLLRDVLLDYKVTPVNATREAKADQLSSRYLLDFKTACCQHTTRVAMAIDVLQKMFFAQRSGLATAIPDLSLINAFSGFETDWQWLGSYERWRALMFLYLYPENVLLPALKPQQTTPFRELITKSRQTPQLTPARAEAFFQEYEQDFGDLSSLALVATAQTYAALTSTSTRVLTVFQIAYGASRKRAYWNAFQPSANSPTTDWVALPGLAKVERVVGACVFQNTKGERYLCIVAFINNEENLVSALDARNVLAIQRLNLFTLEWDEDFKRLDYPDFTTTEMDNTLLVSGKDESWAPVISCLCKRRNMNAYDVYATPFPSYYSASANPLFVLNSTLVLPGFELKQAELLELRFNDDVQSVAVAGSYTVMGFTDFTLAKAIMSRAVMSNDSLLSYICFQRTGPNTSNYLVSCFTTAIPFTIATRSPLFIVSPRAAVNAVAPHLTSADAAISYYAGLVSTQFQALFLGSTPLTDVLPIIGFSPVTTFPPDVNAMPYVPATNTLDLSVGSSKPKPIGLAVTGYMDWSGAVGWGDGFPFFSTTSEYNSFDFYFETYTVSGANITNKLSVFTGIPYDGTVSPYATFHIPAASPLTALSEVYKYVGNSLISSTEPGEVSATLPYVVLEKSISLSGENLQAFVVMPPQASATGFPVTGVSTLLAPVTTYISAPQLPTLRPVIAAGVLEQRRQRLTSVLSIATSPMFKSIVWEGYYYVPLFLSMELYRAKYYEEALRYAQLFYDYTQTTTTSRAVFPGLRSTDPARFDTVMAWLSDAANPHTLADLRPDSHLRFAVASVVRGILGYADSEFSRDTSESVSRARSLYELALGVLKQDILPYDVQDCYALLNQVDPLVPPTWAAQWSAMKDLLAAVNQRSFILNILQNRTISGATRPGIVQLFSAAHQSGNPQTGNWTGQFNAAWQLIDADLGVFVGKYETLCDTQAPSLGGMALPVAQRLGLLAPAAMDAATQALAVQTQQRFLALATRVHQQAGASDYSWLAQRSNGSPDPSTSGVFDPSIQLQLGLNTTRPFVPFLSGSFCVPTNPVPYALLLQAELNLYKIRTCRNIAGIQRELDPYAAPTDTTTGMPAIGANGQLTSTGRLVVPATQYRYAYIIERARQLVSLAQQAEASLLSALEKRDAEAYGLLKARQDIAVSKATIQLQTLRTQEAKDSIDLAELQLQRSELMENQYDEWLNEGLNEFENELLESLRTAGIASAAQIGFTAAASAFNLTAHIASSGLGAALGSPLAVLSVASYYASSAAGIVAALANSRAQISQHRASFERRNQEWNFQRNLATKDIEIGHQQIHLADDRLRIVGQEKRISELQLDNAEAVLNFLTTKFTNAELYDWMSQVLESAYSYFLQQATAMARTAELQLAFERQEAPAGLVQEDYWTPPSDNALDATTAVAVDRKGLTGSIRLLQDLTRLDQFAFETNRRKLQLTKTVSLAQAFPTEFVRFRETGVLPFALSQADFDQDFPGHYLRIIRRVRTSVIALVPPTEGIKAKLSTAGNSRVVVGGTPFQTLTLPRPPESVSLTASINATGLFEMEQQPGELLYPFEGIGVDVPWVFSLQPAANGNLDFTTLADVLLTVEYTALESYDYAQQVVRGMSPERQQLVAFGFRNRFADQWYDLHHAADLANDDQYVARFRLEATDLPANLRNLHLKNISIYLDAPTDEDFTDRSRLGIAFGRPGSDPAPSFTNQYGLISTNSGSGNGPLYTGNAGTLTALIGTSPLGEWELSLKFSASLKARLDAGKVNDLYLILEVEGDAPAYTLV